MDFTEPVVLVLTSLAEGPKHGYALAKDIEAFAGIKLGPRSAASRWNPERCMAR